MTEPTAIGARNPRLRRLRRLVARSRARSEERALVVDGPGLIADAIAAGLEIQEVFAAPGLLDETGIGASLAPGVDRWEVDPSVLAAVLDPVNPRPLAAVVTVPEWGIDDLVPDRPVLVAVELRDPGNLGTVIRSAEAAGFGGVVVAGNSVDRLAPKVVRASAGSLFRTPVVAVADPAAAVDALAASGRPVVAAVVDPDAAPYDRADLTRAAILVGNEPHGLPDDLVARADVACTIPLDPAVESLNVAAATAVLCFEAARQRRHHDGNPLDGVRSGGHGGHTGAPPPSSGAADEITPTRMTT